MPKKPTPSVTDDGLDCLRRSEFIDAALAKRGLTLAKSWPKQQGKPPARPIPGPEAA